MKQYILVIYLFGFYTINLFAQASYPYEPLTFKNYTPIWSHYSKINNFPDTIQNYFQQQIKMASDGKSVYLLHNVADRLFFQGFLLEKVNMIDGNPIWQDYAFSKQKGSRKYAGSMAFKNNNIDLAIFKENPILGSSSSLIWTKGVLQGYRYNDLKGNKVDSVVTGSVDKENKVLGLPTVGGFIKATSSYLFPNAEGTYDYIIQDGTTKSIILTKKKLDKLGHKVDSIQVALPINYNPESARLVKKDDGSFFLFVSTQNPNVAIEKEVKMSFFDKNMNLISGIDISNKFTEKVSGMTYYDDDYFIVSGGYTFTENSVLKSNLTYSLFKYDGSLVENIKDINNHEDIKGFGIAKLSNQAGMLFIKALSQNNQISIHFMKSDGKNALQTLKVIQVSNDNFDIVNLRSVTPTKEGNFLVSFSYANKENLKRTYAEKWTNFTLFSGKDLGLITPVHEIEQKQSFVIFPNPAEAQIEIRSAENFDEVKIYDMTGKIQTSIFTQNSTIEIAVLPSGLYFIELYKENKKISETKKFIKL
jgi:hypothetical protein